MNNGRHLRREIVRKVRYLPPVLLIFAAAYVAFPGDRGSISTTNLYSEEPVPGSYLPATHQTVDVSESNRDSESELESVFEEDTD